MSPEIGEIPLEDQIETRPVVEGIYVAHAGLDGLRRWTGEIWQKSAGWSPCDDPGVIRHLVRGPTLVPARDEPNSVGAVVEEFPSGDLYVRTADDKWISPAGEKTWLDISYPVVRSYGVRA